MTDPVASGSNVGEILDAYLRALETGAAPTREELLARHPEFADELAAALDGLEFVHRAARELASTRESDAESLPPKSIGDFKLLREVGRGGMAVVYEAEQVSLGRRVALKILPFAAVLDPKQLQRFKNEALAAARLQHPNIVPVYAVGSDRGVHYYAMPYVDGESLAVAIRALQGAGDRSGTPSPLSTFGSNREPAYVRMAAALATQAAEALDYAHQLGIVHRDIKPGNLLVDAAGTLFLTDFGLARSAMDVNLTITGELLGTVKYMSPEQAQAKRVPVDHRTDIYSLGATLYELFTLRPAFSGDDPQEILHQIATREPVAPRRINPVLPRDLETIVLKAMSKDPSGRYSTAQEMAEDLKRFLHDQPVQARRPSMLARTARWSMRQRKWIAAASVLMTIGFVTMIFVAAKLSKAQSDTNVAFANARRAVDAYCLQLGVERLSMGDEKLSPARRKLLETALSFYESSAPEEHMQIGNILGSLSRFEEAEAAFRRAIAANPNVSDLHLHLGLVLRELGREREALESFERAVAVDPNNGYALYHRAAAVSNLDDPVKALAAYDEAIASPSAEGSNWLPSALSNRSKYFAKSGRVEQAKADLERAITLDPLNGTAHGNLGAIFCDYLGDYPRALQEYDRAAQLVPDQPQVHLGRGNVLGHMGHHDLAILAFNVAIELAPGNASLWDARGYARYSTGDVNGAFADFNRAIELDPKEVQALCNRAHAHLAFGREIEALRDFDSAIEADPKAWKALLDRGSLYSQMRDVDAAFTDVRASLDIEPRCAATRYYLGRLLAATGQFDEAMQEYDAAIATTGEHALRADFAQNAYVYRGHCHVALGQLPKAIPDWEHALELGVRDPELLNTIAWILATAPDRSLRNPARAVQRAWQAVTLKPADGNLWNTLGVAHCAAEEWEEALGTLARSMKLRNGGDSYDWFFSAIASKKLGRDEEARGFYDKAVAGIPRAPGDPSELKRYRDEAAALLDVK